MSKLRLKSFAAVLWRFIHSRPPFSWSFTGTFFAQEWEFVGMVQLETEAGKVALDNEQPWLVTWVRKRYVFMAELVGEEIEICVYDVKRRRDFTFCPYPQAAAMRLWRE